MAKGSHKAAARYAAAGKRKKGRQYAKRRPPEQAQVVSQQAKPLNIAPTPALRSESQLKPRPELRRGLDYRYVSGELKRIGIIAGAIFAILIVLAFLLG